MEKLILFYSYLEFDGESYYAQSFFSKYLCYFADTFESLTVVASIKKVDQSDKVKIDHLNVQIVKLPYILKYTDIFTSVDYVKSIFELNQVLKRYDKNNTLCIVREPYPLNFIVILLIIIRRLKFNLHIVGDIITGIEESNHYSWMGKNTYSILYRVYVFFLLRVANIYANNIFCNGKAVTQKFLKYSLLGNGKIQVVLSSTLLDSDYYSKKFLPLSQKKEIRILFLGFLRPDKGVDYLIKSIDKINHPHVSLHIIGSGTCEERLKLISTKCRNTVKFYGYMNHSKLLSELMNTMDILVLPTINSEGTPRVILEAMARDIAVIATNVGSVEDTVKHRITGLLIETKNSNAIAEKINYCIADDKLYNSLLFKAKELSKNNRMNDFLRKISD